MNKFNSPQFKALNAEWAKKLKNSGFTDIELGEKYLKWSPEQTLSRESNKNKVVFYNSVENYYRVVGYFLHEHEFETEKERQVWELHAEGKSLSETSQILKTRGIKIARTQVKECIHKVRVLMFAKYKELEHE